MSRSSRKNPFDPDTYPMDPCEQLRLLLPAYHALMAGHTRVRVRHRDYEIEYHKSSLHFLEREVRKLQVQCGDPARGGIRRGGLRLH